MRFLVGPLNYKIPGLIPSGMPPIAQWPHQWFWDGQEHVDPAKEASAHEDARAHARAPLGRGGVLPFRHSIPSNFRSLRYASELSQETCGHPVLLRTLP